MSGLRCDTVQVTSEKEGVTFQHMVEDNSTKACAVPLPQLTVNRIIVARQTLDV